MNDKVEKTEIVAANKEPLKTIQPAAAVTPMAMLNMAVEQGADLDKMTKLMDLQERWEANESKKAFISAMSKFRADCPTIEKTETAHNSKHASLAGTIKQIKVLMSENGLSHSWITSQLEGGITVQCCVTHVQGHSECTSLTAAPDTSGSKNDIQAIGSTITYLERYTLSAVLGLASGDADDDGSAAGQHVERISEEQAMTIHATLTDGGVDVDRFESWLRRDWKCDGIDGVSVDNYEACLGEAKQAVKNKENKK